MRPRPLTASALIALHAERLARDAEANIYERGRSDERLAVIAYILRKDIDYIDTPTAYRLAQDLQERLHERKP